MPVNNKLAQEKIVYARRFREIYKRKKIWLLFPVGWVAYIYDIVEMITESGKYRGYLLTFLDEENKKRILKNIEGKETYRHNGIIELTSLFLLAGGLYAGFCMNGINVIDGFLTFMAIVIASTFFITMERIYFWRGAKEKNLIKPLPVYPKYSTRAKKEKDVIRFIDRIGKSIKLEEIDRIEEVGLLMKIGLFLEGYFPPPSQVIKLKNGTRILLSKEIEKARGKYINKRISLVFLTWIGLSWSVYYFLLKGELLFMAIFIVLFLSLEV